MMMNAVKFLTCEKHERRVWRPLGQPCPACHPELYPVKEKIENGSPGCAFVTVCDTAPLQTAAQMALDVLDDLPGARVAAIVQTRGALIDALGGGGDRRARVRVNDWPVAGVAD